MWPEPLLPAPHYPFIPQMRRVEPVVRIQPQNPDKRTPIGNNQVGTLIDVYV
jgi:hypothetical protein